MHAIQKLTELLADMPGVGPRQARRIVHFLLRATPSFRNSLAESIRTLAEAIAQCKSCFRYDEVNKEGRCALCASPTRDKSTLTVVEKDVDVEGVESVGFYTGAYFVLGSLIPLTEYRKRALAPRTQELLARLAVDTAITEVVLAFATTPEGDYTAQELKQLIREKKPGIRVSMLARGLSLGAEIEYADQETLRNAFRGRA